MTFALSVVVAFAGRRRAVVGVLRLHRHRRRARAAARLAEARGPLARDVFTFFHYPIVLGIIFYAVAAKKTLEHPLDPLSEAGRWALGLGIAVFLLGFALMRFRVIRRVAWERIAAAAAVVLIAVLLDGTDAIVTLGAVVGFLVASIALESARLREVRRSLKSA